MDELVKLNLCTVSRNEPNDDRRSSLSDFLKKAQVEQIMLWTVIHTQQSFRQIMCMFVNSGFILEWALWTASGNIS